MKSLIALCLCIASINALPLDSLLVSTQSQFNGSIWVVLVAGSNEWYNYRHQADVYHAYQTVHNHGIPDSNIIVFHYDDIANNAENPTPGVVINKPGGSDVYHGVPKDYTGADVTPANFLNAIQGSQQLAAMGKKVVNSGPNDHVFIYFTDHGATDLIAFPSEYLYGEDLMKALQAMYNNKRYAKLVFYLEACESGSMFNTLLPKNINIYATTAANPTESSYACYYDSTRETYLGDVYSVNWIENSDVRTLGSETLEQQFQIVRNETNTSHCQEYGDLTMSSLTLTEFQGNKSASAMNLIIGSTRVPAVMDAVDSGDVPIMIARKRIESAKTEELRKLRVEEYEQMLRSRQQMNVHMYNIAEMMHNITWVTPSDLINKRLEVFNLDCYRAFVDTFHKSCYNVNTHWYALRKLYILGNICYEIFNQYRTIEYKYDSVSLAINKMQDYCDSNVFVDTRVL